MMAYIWNNGLFAWPFVIFIVWCTVILLATDVLWRVVKMRTALLLGYTGVAWVAGLVVIGLAGYVLI